MMTKPGVEQKRENCLWTEDEAHGYWATECGGVWVFEGWVTNQIRKFCPFCGGKLQIK